MWVARDKDGIIHFFPNNPKRHEDKGWWVSIPYGEQCMIGEDMFPNLKWEDEPIEVELTIKK